MPNMDEERCLDRKRANWCKFERYEIEDQFIGPAPGAALHEYSPWEAYQRTESQRRTVEPPYVPLLELARKIAFRAPDRLRSRYVPTPENAALILEWCNNHGLLGILPAVARRMIVAPQRRMSTETDPGGSARGILACTAYTLEAGEWVRKIRESTDEAKAHAIPESQEGKGPVPAKVWHDQWPRPSVTSWRWDKHEWQEQQWSEVAASFFPTVKERDRDSFQYPWPCTGEFWRLYREPVQLFARWIDDFAAAADILNGYDPTKHYDPDEWLPITNSLDFLNSLNATGTPRVLSRPVARVVASPSLLSSYADMLLRDLEDGRRVHRCGTCGKVFVSDDPRAQYCSRRCRNTMQRRRQRRSQSGDPDAHGED